MTLADLALDGPEAALTPPAPPVPATDLPTWRLVSRTLQSTLGVWPDYAFDVLVNKRTTLGIPGVLVNDPAWVRHVLGANAANYRRPPVVRRVGLPVGGDGLFFAEGADWRRQRRILAPSFTPASLDVLVPHFHEAALHLLRAVGDRNVANLSQAFQDTALEAVLRALFSMPDDGARTRLGAMVRAFIAGPGRPGLFDGFATDDDSFAFALGGRRRFQRAWFGEIDAIIAARRAQSSRPGHRDMLDLLLELKDAETGAGLAEAEIRDQCATMFFAGSETTARLMFWAMYLLALDPAEQARVGAELTGQPAERIGRLKDLDDWPRLRCVLYEAMRLYPPLPHIRRDAVAADRLETVEVCPGDQIWISPWVMHRHRKFWRHPTAFLPDRFADAAAPWVQMPAYIPFGAGPRICIGLNFALMEAQIALAHLLQRFEVRLASDAPDVLPIGRVTTEPSYEPMFRLVQRS